MDIQQIGKEAGVIEKFLQELPEKAFHYRMKSINMSLLRLSAMRLSL